ncbi:transporter, RhtB family [Geotalea daltonii FRC-32]|uniref:Transporter, RhtB family n=1 Tax=Geotalea daltonii (strain DSM 22248 / JCM 15807 / FRC-32) TaxID=316067 RepID=B9M1B1_GEODF|nr:LysE family translocator [Geotalea daltonii]ACM19181.1 transporter, RhtB family [Geotalea daltonii FRC-32]
MTNIFLFLTASILLTLAPGPDNIYILTRGIAQGRNAALAAAFGFTTGLIGHTMVVAFGLAAVIRSSDLLFGVIKFAGAGYLLYLGYRTLRNREPLIVSDTTDQSSGLRRVYCQSVLANLLNPKVSLFFLSFLPQFIQPTLGHGELQALALGGLFMLETLVIFCLIALCSGNLGKWLRKRPAVSRHLNSAAGVTFIGIGLSLAFSERNA